jgi:ApbE superfamily uncharacterized protein (UPF0280 family)
MIRQPHVALLADGRRLHMSDGPIDLIIEGFGTPEAIDAAYGAAQQRFTGLLDELCAELAALRRPASPDAAVLTGPVARRMEYAVQPFAAQAFITPMAAVAGSVADEILAAMVAAASLTRAYVNNGGDIALHLTPGTSFVTGLVDRPDRPGLFATTHIAAGDGIAGIATSGARGRSFSLGIADAVTVLARTAAAADAAATIIANAVDLPGDERIARVPARELQPDSDLGDIAVTRMVPPLPQDDIATALQAGLAKAEDLRERGLMEAAALHLQGMTLVTPAQSTIANVIAASPSLSSLSLSYVGAGADYA